MTDTEKYPALELLAIVEKANPPKLQEGDWVCDVQFEQDGWKFEIFYDCGELDYIDHFTTPGGVMLSVWPQKNEMSDWQKTISSWQGVGDLERLSQNETPSHRSNFGTKNINPYGIRD